MICSMFMGYLVQMGWILKKLKHTGTFSCIFDRHAKKFATDARRYVGRGPGSLRFQHITLIQEIAATTWTCSRLRLRWMTEKQQPVDNFAPRANLKCLFKDDAISSGDSEVKETASRYFCWGEARAWVYQTYWGTANCIYDKREFRIVLLRFRILGGGALKILKPWRGGRRKCTNKLNSGPVKIWAFFKTSSSPPPPPRNKCTFPYQNVPPSCFRVILSRAKLLTKLRARNVPHFW